MEMELKREYMLSRRSGGEEGSSRGMKKISSLARKIAGLIEWLAYTIYKYIGLYGESIARPIAWAIFFIILFGLLRLSMGCSLDSCMWESLT
ncbi:MAG: hypothetical protein ACP5IE_03740, partial [Infirmifilum sp.]